MAAYAVFGTSRHLKVTVSSTMAVMSASVVADLASCDPAAYLAFTAALALTVGVMLVAAGLARLGFISTRSRGTRRSGWSGAPTCSGLPTASSRALTSTTASSTTSAAGGSAWTAGPGRSPVGLAGAAPCCQG
jgi:hypothetical protein